MKPAVATLALLLAIAAACAQVPPAVQPATPRADPPGQADAVRRALEDAAARLGVAIAALPPPRVEQVTWRDGSLGCPEPGLMYPQVLMPGYRIVVASAGSVLEYHAAERGQFLHCPAGRSVPPLPVPAGR